MLSDAEREGMLEMARSAAIREEFRALRAMSAIPSGEHVDVDALIAFLSAMNRLLPLPAREHVEYSRVLL